jgi:hypothetical protein
MSSDEAAGRALVLRVAEHDRAIQSWQAHVVTHLDGKLMADMEWGCQGRMEYLSGYRYVTLEHEEEPRKVTEGWAFDGEKMRGLRANPAGPNSSGCVKGLVPRNFQGIPSARTLLGGDLKTEEWLRFGDALLKCPHVALRDATEEVCGRQCAVLELVGGDTWPEGKVDDLLFWIDEERDCRVLRYDRFSNYHPVVRWEFITRSVEVNGLERIDGHWFPTGGTVTTFNCEFQPRAPFTREDYSGLTPEQVAERGIDVKRTKARYYTIDVDPSSVHVNRLIPAHRFSIDFPDGCFVTDDFLGKTYRVGFDQTA